MYLHRRSTPLQRNITACSIMYSIYILNSGCFFFVFLEIFDYVERRIFPDGKPVESTMSLTRKDFKIAGEIMAMSIMQGGQAPNLMASQIFDYLCGKLSISQMNSVSSREICEKVRS